MAIGRVMLIASKETFLVQVLVKKLTESNFDISLVKADITYIEDEWDQLATVIYYIDHSEVIPTEILHYLEDKLTETDKQIAFVGEKSDAEMIRRTLPGGLIWETFIRPLDMNKFLPALTKHAKVDEASLRKHTILVIDDDPTYIGVIREWLRGRYKVGMANSGAQALQWLGLNAADLILLDYEMPVVSGPRVLEMLRSDPDTADIPVFFLTSRGDRDSVMSVMEWHPENYLLKTIDRGELLQKLDDFFLRQESYQPDI
ncbi:MAG: response regulator [Lachnospiraceae bacterium]|nr:response regulator [Lachnospiraceae bacterium]